MGGVELSCCNDWTNSCASLVGMHSPMVALERGPSAAEEMSTHRRAESLVDPSSPMDAVDFATDLSS